MNILFVSAVLPYPLHSGGQIRMYNLLRRLGRRHTITLVSFIRNEEERKELTHLSFCKEVVTIMRGRAWQPKYYLRSVFGKYPFLLATYDNARMKGMLTTLLTGQQFDLVHIEPFYVLPSLPKLSVPWVISEHNVEYEVYNGYVRRFPVPLLRPVLGIDVMKLKAWEVNAWKRASVLTAVSENDASVMKTYTDHPVHVVPNGVDLNAFPYQAPRIRKSMTVLFVGNFRWHPNREAATVLVNRIWPEITKSFKDMKLRIVGRDIPADLSERVGKLGGTVSENVDDIATVYRSADVMVAPHAISGGTKFKMLEAMASGLPIITTPSGVVGLGLVSGTHYLEAETPSRFVEEMGLLRKDAKLAQRLSLNARKCVENIYNWDRIADALDRVWTQAYEKK